MTERRKIYLFSIHVNVAYKHFFYDIYEKRYVCIESWYMRFENYFMKYSYIGYQDNLYPKDWFSIIEPSVVNHVLEEKYYSLSISDIIEICNNYLLNKIVDTL